jgi:DnaJ-class molecular chaperone
LDPQDHKAYKAHKVSKAYKVMLDPQDHRAYKVMLDQQGHRAYKVIKAMLVQQAQLGLAILASRIQI